MGTERNDPDDQIGLRDAAARLGVHYMTAYRYVRLGVLPATKAHGEWQVRLSDLAQVTSHKDAAPRGAGVQSWSRYRTQFTTRLVAGDEAGAWAIVERALAAGASASDVHLEIIGPSLRTIGDSWAANKIAIADEHRASVVATRIVSRLGPRFARRGRKVGAVVLGAAPGDRHSLPTAILADILRSEGLDTIDLGADTPVASFIETASARDDLVAVAICVGADETMLTVTAAVREIRAALPDVAIFVGGPAVPGEAAARRLGATAYGASARDVADQCIAFAREPRREM